VLLKVFPPCGTCVECSHIARPLRPPWHCIMHYGSCRPTSAVQDLLPLSCSQKPAVEVLQERPLHFSYIHSPFSTPINMNTGRKRLVCQHLDFFQPGMPLLKRTRNNDTEHPAVECGHTTQSKYTSSPQGFQRVAKYGLLSFIRRIGSIKDQGNPGL